MLLAHSVFLVAIAWTASLTAAGALAVPSGQTLSIVAGWLELAGLMAMMFATFFTGLLYAC